jgi:hypothetical protein
LFCIFLTNRKNFCYGVRQNLFDGDQTMKLSLRTSTLALALMLCVAPFASLSAQAKSTFMTDCSAKFKAAKAAGTIDAATKWTDFMKTTCKADAAAAAPDATAPAAATPAKATKPATTAMDATTTPSGSFMQNCSASWKAMKAANTVPPGMKWKDFVAAKCVATPAAAPATTTAAATAPAAPSAMSASFIKKCGDDWKAMKAAGTVPAGLTWKDFVIGKCVAKPAAAGAASTAPAATPAAVKKTTSMAPAEPTTADPAVKLVDKNGKPFTPGQLAAHERARTCGAKWRAEKAAGTLQAGLKWPQYWSACNTELKAAAAQ